MNDTAKKRVYLVLAHVAVPSAAFLTFLLQPIVGKLIVPLHGSDAGTWVTTMSYFQLALLGGYALAYFLIAQTRQTQRYAMTILAISAPMLLRLPPLDIGSIGSPYWLMLSLALSTLPAVVLTTSIGLLLQAWGYTKEQGIPYYLYALSNIGSLGALLLYPFLIEPYIGVAAQVSWVRAAFASLSLAILLLVWLLGRNTAAAEAPQGKERITIFQLLWWTGLAAIACVLMLGATRVLTAEFGSNPLTWVLPLGLYLASFSLTFSGWWRGVASAIAVFVLGVSVLGFLFTKGFTSSPVDGPSLIYLLLIVGSGTSLAHSMAYAARPAVRFGPFYLSLAVGGALGGQFASLVAPNIFERNFEFLAAASVIFVGGLVTYLASPKLLSRVLISGIMVLPILLESQRQISGENTASKSTRRLRNHYGEIVLAAEGGRLSCASETTLHGGQYLDPNKRREPTTYYARGSSVGLIIQQLQAEKPRLRVGVIGLGVGILAAYARETDTFVFWEINPQMVTVAREVFTYLSDSKGKVEIRLQDGRIGVLQDPEPFDLLIGDAFSGDAVPTHLITREAIAGYIEKVPDGLVLIHTSNRYCDLYPVLAAHAQALGVKAWAVHSSPPQRNAADPFATASVYTVIGSRQQMDALSDTLEHSAKTQNWKYAVRDEPQHAVEWTDDRHAIIQVLEIGRLFSPAANLPKP